MERKRIVPCGADLLLLHGERIACLMILDLELQKIVNGRNGFWGIRLHPDTRSSRKRFLRILDRFLQLLHRAHAGRRLVVHKMRNREIPFGKHCSDVLEMRLDSVNLLGVLRIIRRYLNDATIVGKDEVMCGRRLTETHAGMTLATLDHALMMFRVRLRRILRDHEKG